MSNVDIKQEIKIFQAFLSDILLRRFILINELLFIYYLYYELFKIINEVN